MDVRRTAAVLAAAALLAVPGCAAASASRSPGPASASTERTSPVTLTGTLRHGVEPGCTVFEATDGTSYVLAGDTAGIAPGTAVQITGEVQPDVMSYCNSGATLEVATITSR